tara:strand:- start:242 stop:868 length:627 start_codon:yes stop_codon:yes gene_type:complete
MSKITIVDYGLGNLRSINKKLHNFNINSNISDCLNDIKDADILILPGVGNFKKAMKNIKSFGIYDILDEKVRDQKTPILGVCLGMQLFTNYSDEGNCKGFGWVDADTKIFNKDKIKQKVPHIGWGKINILKNKFIFDKINTDHNYYFVHSYYVDCFEPTDILCTTKYGNFEFVSGFVKENIFGLQFHPEKSHRIGMEIFKNFINHFAK